MTKNLYGQNRIKIEKKILGISNVLMACFRADMWDHFEPIMMKIGRLVLEIKRVRVRIMC